jgi:hypothetical protein
MPAGIPILNELSATRGAAVIPIPTSPPGTHAENGTGRLAQPTSHAPNSTPAAPDAAPKAEMPAITYVEFAEPLAQFRVIDALAMADGSAGWCAMIGSDGGYVSAFLDQDVARAMYPDVLVATGAAATRTGQAVRVRGATTSAGVFRLSAVVSTAKGCGWAALLWTMASHGSMATACRKPGSAFCDCRNAKS